MIDFSKCEKPEGMTDEMLADSKFQGFLKSHIEGQKDVAVSLLKEKLGTRDKTLAERDDEIKRVNKSLEEAKGFKKGENEEIDRLTEQLKTAKETVKIEMQAQIDAKQNALDESNQASEGYKKQLTKAEITQHLQAGIAAYNAENKTVPVQAGAEQHLVEAGLRVFKKTEDGAIRAFKGDEALTGKEGFMTGAEFIATQRESNPFFFQQAQGGGAAGGNNGGAGENWGQYFEPKTRNLTKQAELQKANPALFGQLSEKHKVN